ncbi:hypothetical protein [Neoroseomonas oryzicola]|uniref:Uncharacterized protein n=1 Tax=Neoroseomonas oryzicola TaxID=535904 RepID=A0A9X9WLX6_9PROT|nr:hypothetical protein [Neoroseomonas oryzicola]MBR0661336.1 hypothetical protein [Neoroseomonas oryzicola]NKE18826.1 hypothetical protein [Neoroseomonas oryzicola]
MLQRLRTSEALRQKSGRLEAPPPLQHMTAIPPLRFTSCQWVTEAAPPWPRCGEPTEGGCAWCEPHKRVVFQPREETPMP